MRRIVLLLLVLLLVGFGGYFFYRNFTYSEGTRTGYLMKMSKKGLLFKTFEGEMNLGGIQGEEYSAIVSNKIWNFSVPTDRADVFEKLQELEGRQIQVRYKEKNQAFFWQGDTDYFVYDAKLVKAPNE